MNIYQKTSRWKYYLAVFAALIILGSLIYTNYLSTELAIEEKKTAELFSKTWIRINNSAMDEDLTYEFDINNSMDNIPFIVVDEKDEIISYKNLPEKKTQDPFYLRRQLESMKRAKEPIEQIQPSGLVHTYYYKDSFLLKLLELFPIVQISIIGLFLATAYYLFSQARQAEQNQVWVGMSKETAHQLGTPLSSLMGWVEYLKASEDEKLQSALPEIEKDVNRLELVTDRFSKIGSTPKLEIHNLCEVIEETATYMEKRSSKQVSMTTEYEHKELNAELYPPLFNWVLENLLKNALDAMDGQGNIHIHAHTDKKHNIIDVSDTGKGIGLRNKNLVFRPGYSTKKRGWGLGLSLSKRIINEYHHGKIFVKSSEKGKGTTFRIILDKLKQNSL